VCSAQVANTAAYRPPAPGGWLAWLTTPDGSAQPTPDDGGSTPGHVVPAAGGRTVSR
jgi:hypothetical protein